MTEPNSTTHALVVTDGLLEKTGCLSNIAVAMGLLRSEPMKHGTLVVPVDRAREFIDLIGAEVCDVGRTHATIATHVERKCMSLGI